MKAKYPMKLYSEKAAPAVDPENGIVVLDRFCALTGWRTGSHQNTGSPEWAPSRVRPITPPSADQSRDFWYVTPFDRVSGGVVWQITDQSLLAYFLATAEGKGNRGAVPIAFLLFALNLAQNGRLEAALRQTWNMVRAKERHKCWFDSGPKHSLNWLQKHLCNRLAACFERVKPSSDARQINNIVQFNDLATLMRVSLHGHSMKVLAERGPWYLREYLAADIEVPVIEAKQRQLLPSNLLRAYDTLRERPANPAQIATGRLAVPDDAVSAPPDPPAQDEAEDWLPILLAEWRDQRLTILDPEDGEAVDLDQLATQHELKVDFGAWRVRQNHTDEVQMDRWDEELAKIGIRPLRGNGRSQRFNVSLQSASFEPRWRAHALRPLPADQRAPLEQIISLCQGQGIEPPPEAVQKLEPTVTPVTLVPLKEREGVLLVVEGVTVEVWLENTAVQRRRHLAAIVDAVIEGIGEPMPSVLTSDERQTLIEAVSRLGRKL